MQDRISARWNIVLSFSCYLIGAPLLTYFVSPFGFGGVLFAYPLYTVTWLRGRKQGFVTATIGIGLNSAVWVLAGKGIQTLSRASTTYFVVLLLVESLASAVFVIVVSNIRRREEQSRDEIRRSTDLLHLSEVKYRDLIEAAPLPIFVLESGKLIFFNNLAHEMLGYSREELMGLSMRSILHKEDYEKARQLYTSRFESMRLPKSITRIVTKDGRVLWVETIGQRIEWEGRPAVLYFSSDVTERRKLEEQFAQAQKMEAIGQLTGGVAHDFNNVLQVITGYCEVLRLNVSEKNKKDVEQIALAAERAASLTKQLLAFSRKQILRPRVVETRSLVHSIEKMLERVIGEDIEVRSIIDPNTGNFLADPGQMEQVLMNLAVNARDAMPSGGKLTIETENATFDETYVRDHPGAKAGQYVRLAVSDSGVGMDRETLSHIYEPFFTTKEKGKGTGLGLSTVYGIVKQSEGYINCYSEPGRGTTFTIYLPLTREKTDKAPLAAPATSAPGGTETILLVDDDEAVRNIARVVLEMAGYPVIEASGAEEAFSGMVAGSISVSLLITDVVLPRMSGKELAQRFKVIVPGVRVLYISGYTANVISHHGILEPDLYFLQKPFSSIQLLMKVREILDRP